MLALTLLIVRHAEKPNKNEPEPHPGLTIEGAEDSKSLVVRGWQRASAWAALFGTGLGGDDYPLDMLSLDPPFEISALKPIIAAQPECGELASMD